jgi:hypothetical protein
LHAAPESYSNEKPNCDPVESIRPDGRSSCIAEIPRQPKIHIVVGQFFHEPIFVHPILDPNQDVDKDSDMDAVDAHNALF